MESFILIKKSQIWSFEFIVAAIIFIIAILIFYKYSINLSNEEEVALKEQITDAKILSNYLMSEGLPDSWNTTNVILVGLTDDNYKINGSKLRNFSQLDYTTTKSIFSIINDYYVFFEDKNGNGFSIDGIQGVGKPGVNRTNLNSTEDPDNIIQVFRFVIYNSTIIKMGIYVW